MDSGDGRRSFWEWNRYHGAGSTAARGALQPLSSARAFDRGDAGACCDEPLRRGLAEAPRGAIIAVVDAMWFG